MAIQPFHIIATPTDNGYTITFPEYPELREFCKEREAIVYVAIQAVQNAGYQEGSWIPVGDDGDRLSWEQREAMARKVMIEAGYDEKEQEEVLVEMRMAHRKL